MLQEGTFVLFTVPHLPVTRQLAATRLVASEESSPLVPDVILLVLCVQKPLLLVATYFLI